MTTHLPLLLTLRELGAILFPHTPLWCGAYLHTSVSLNCTQKHVSPCAVNVNNSRHKIFIRLVAADTRHYSSHAINDISTDKIP